MTEWQPVTAEDTMEIGIIGLAGENLLALQTLMLSVLNRTVQVYPPDTGEGIYTIPFASYINQIEQSINALTANGYVPNGMQPVRNWLGENRDRQALSYKDVNRWFDSFLRIEQMVYGLSGRVVKTGTFVTGHDRTRQLIRMVKQ